MSKIKKVNSSISEVDQAFANSKCLNCWAFNLFIKGSMILKKLNERCAKCQK